MSEFLFHLRFWLIAALVVGVVTGAVMHGWSERLRHSRWLGWTGIAAVTGLLALALGAAPEPPALYLGAAIAAYIAYLLGAAFGAMVAGGDLRAHDGWALGLLPVALLWWGAVVTTVPDYQKRRVAQTITAAPGAPTALETPASPNPTETPAVSAAEEPFVACQRALDAAVAAGPLAFQPRRVAIHKSVALALDAAVSVIRTCPAGVLEVTAQGDSPGNAGQALGRRRAEAVIRYLNREGVGDQRLIAAEPGPETVPSPGAVRFRIEKLSSQKL
jgi:outer membrane protein OmpA-like peptidoglycan-associated protein